LAKSEASDPWSNDYRIRLIIANALGVVLIGIGWYQARGLSSVRTEISWLELSIVGLVIAGTANALWLLRGRQVVTLARVAVFADIPRRQTTAAADHAHTQVTDVLVWAQGMTRFHRPDCLLVVNKRFQRLTDTDTESLNPCEVCSP
jgi:hypothetical protein